MTAPETTRASGPVTSFRFVLLGASFGTGNLGVAALASGTIAAVIQSRPGARIVLFDYGREPATYQVKCPKGSASVPLINIRFSKKPWHPNHIARLLLTACFLKLIPSRRFRERVVLRNPYLKPLWEADMIGAISGGDSFSDIYGLGRLVYVSLPQLLILLLNKPLVLLPQTIGPFQGLWAQSIARCLLRRAALVYSRDRTSLDEIKPLLGSRASRLRFSYDVGFALEPVRPPLSETAWLDQPNRSRPCVGLNVSGLLLMGGYTQDNMFGLKGDYRILMRKLVEFFVREQGAEVLLVPHVFGEAPESDSIACSQLYGELSPEYPGRLHVIQKSLDQYQIKYLISRCDFFVGSRMHACIAAIAQSVPAVALAYSGKFLGVMESVGVAGILADLRQQSQTEILATVAEAYRRRASLREALNNRMTVIKDSVLAVFSPEYIANFK